MFNQNLGGVVVLGVVEGAPRGGDRSGLEREERVEGVRERNQSRK